MATIVAPTPMPTLADAPELRFRHFRGVALDIPWMAAANQAARTAAGEVEPIEIADMGTTYGHLTNCDPGRDICVVEADGVIAGYGRVFWLDPVFTRRPWPPAGGVR